MRKEQKQWMFCRWIEPRFSIEHTGKQERSIKVRFVMDRQPVGLFFFFLVKIQIAAFWFSYFAVKLLLRGERERDMTLYSAGDKGIDKCFQLWLWLKKELDFWDIPEMMQCDAAVSKSLGQH